MTNLKQHNFDDGDKCKNCELSKEYIEDNKITNCKSKLKNVLKLDKKVKNNKYI